MNTVHILFPETIGTVNPNIYGHFVEHIGGVVRDGIWVGENSPIPNVHGFRKALLDKFRAIRPSVVRWPGGGFADLYDWRDGIGPRSNRPVTAPRWYPFDGRLEDNQVGTHEIMEFCRYTGAEPYFAANVTSVSPLHTRAWIDYCNMPRGTTSLAREREQNGAAEPFGIRYWGLGNENWGDSGNMTAEDYCYTYRKYAQMCSSVGRGCQFIACGPNGTDADWVRRFFAKYTDDNHFVNKLDGFAAHYYCGTAGGALDFTEEQWYQQLKQALAIEPLICAFRGVMDSYDPQRKIGLLFDEWGCWHADDSGPSAGGNLWEQQSCMRDALVAALTLNTFNNHCDKVVMANIAQLVNNLHSLFLAHEDQCITTPNYHVFDMMKEHQGGRALRTLCDADSLYGVPRVQASSSEKEGKTIVTLVNCSYNEPAEIDLRLHGRQLPSSVLCKTLVANPHAHNTFAEPDAVVPTSATLRPVSDSLTLTLPASSVTCLHF